MRSSLLTGGSSVRVFNWRVSGIGSASFTRQFLPHTPQWSLQGFAQGGVKSPPPLRRLSMSKCCGVTPREMSAQGSGVSRGFPPQVSPSTSHSTLDIAFFHASLSILSSQASNPAPFFQASKARDPARLSPRETIPSRKEANGE